MQEDVNVQGHDQTPFCSSRPEVPCACGALSMTGERRLLRLCRGVHVSVIVGQATVVSFETGRYYIVRGMGSRIFTPMIGGFLREADFVERSAAFPSSEPTETVAKATRELVEWLIAERLVEYAVTKESPSPVVDSYTDAEAFTPPTRFDDMADILTQDPIHEVGPNGWPARA